MPADPFLESLLSFLGSFWWLFLLAALPPLFRFIQAQRRQARLKRAGLLEVDTMSGEDFERFLELLFRQLGYEVNRTPYRGDYGADLLLVKDGQKTAVQAKRSANTVGLQAVQEVVAARAFYDCTRTLVVTNNSFSPQARRLATPNQVELWDREALLRIIELRDRHPTPPTPTP